MTIARTSLIIFIMRFSNVGLMMIGPIVLARLLPVYDFGLYREFLIYSGAMMTMSAFALSQGLMYLVPANPGHTWALVRQTAILTAISGLLITGLAATANVLAGGHLLGNYGMAVLAYTLLYVNIDFWEHLWISQNRPTSAFYYTFGRLALRLGTVIVVAVLTRNITTIIYALLLLELVRIAGSAIAWKALHKQQPSPKPGLWAAQLRYCLPLGVSLLLKTVNNYIGSFFISVSLGAVMLAQYSVGTYAVPIIYMLRNSVSDALLPHMAGAERDSDGRPSLGLWHQSNTLFAILLIPLGIMLARFAELIIVVLFSDQYLPAVPLFQVYLLSLLTQLVDMGVPLRLLDRTRAYLYSTIGSIGINVLLLLLLLPRMGAMGAVIATVSADFVALTVHTVVIARLTRIPVTTLLSIPNTVRVLVAAIVPLPLLLIPVHTGLRGIPLAALLCAAYCALFATILWRLGTSEVREMLRVALARVPVVRNLSLLRNI
jgi:O-antigen/teichoic acid export membrane protein